MLEMKEAARTRLDREFGTVQKCRIRGISMTVYLHTHHKCASRWAIAYFEKLGQMNGLSFAHEDRSTLVGPSDADLQLFGNSAYIPARELGGIHLIRNPLDMLVSAYHSHRRTHPDDHWPALSTQRRLLSIAGQEAGLHLTLTFLERSDINADAVGPYFALRNWDFSDPSFTTVRVEDFTSAPAATASSFLGSDLLYPTDDAFSFERFTGRAVGTVDSTSHYRSGQSGQWRAVVPEDIVRYVQELMPELVARYYPEIAIHGRDWSGGFYSQDESTRVAATTIAMSDGSTVMERWSNLGTGEAGQWSFRHQAAADFLADESTVADLGCGLMTIEGALRTGTKYVPVDVVARDARTIVADFNTAPVPSLGASGAAALGLIEYLHDPENVLRQLRSQCRVVALSYNTLSNDIPIRQRRGHAWVNDYTKAEVLQLVSRAGWQVADERHVRGSEYVWKLV